MTDSHLGDLLSKTGLLVKRHVVVGAVEVDAIVLWNAHTYVYECGRATAYLHPYSPEPGSGKTTLLDVLELTARNAVQADNLSEAALFRLIDKIRPTLLFDEVDAIFGKKNSDAAEGIRQVLNSGYRKDKKVWRCVPPSHDVVAFDVYCPKATAGLHELPGTLAHRSIPIAMRPPRPDDIYEELDPEELESETEMLRMNLQLWADEAEDALRDPRLKPERLDALDARGNEIWRILFRTADLAGGDWPARARTAAVELSGRDRQHRDASATVRLFAHIRGLFTEERMTCASIVEALNADDLLPYGGWSDGKGITTRELGKKVAPYGVLAKPIRIGGVRTGNGYERDQFEDVWSRYLPADDRSHRYTGTTRMVEPKTAGTKPVQTTLVPVPGNGGNPYGQTVVPVVPVPAPKLGSDAPEWERAYWAKRAREAGAA